MNQHLSHTGDKKRQNNKAKISFTVLELNYRTLILDEENNRVNIVSVQSVNAL